MALLSEKYIELVRVVQKVHETRKMAHGHDFDHAFAVANLAGMFCEDPAYAKIAWIAGLCHNADRMIALDLGTPRREVPDTAVERLVREWLAAEDSLTPSDEAVVVLAVLNHGKPNDPTDDYVTVALKDADRVVCARLDVVIRAGQLQPELPVCDPILLLSDKRGKYNGRLTVLADLTDCLDWGNLDDSEFGVRTEKAKAMILGRVNKLREFLELIVEQRKDEGLIPYPAGLT